MAEADAARRSGNVAAEESALSDAIMTARRGYDVEPFDPIATERPQAMALWAETLARAGRCSEALDLLGVARVTWPRDPSLADIGAWVAAREGGRDPSSASVSEELAARLATAPACASARVGRHGPLLRDLERRLVEGDPIAFRASAAFLLASPPEAGAARDDVLRRLRGHVDPLPPAVDAERAALLRVLDPADGRLPTLLASDDDDRRRTALSTAAHYGFATVGVLDVVKTAFVASPLAARRLEFARVALVDRSAPVTEFVFSLLADADASVREGAWNSLSSTLPAARREAAGYDPAGTDAERTAAIERLRGGR